MQPPLDLLRRVDDNHLMGVPFGRLGWQSPSDLTFGNAYFVARGGAVLFSSDKGWCRGGFTTDALIYVIRKFNPEGELRPHLRKSLNRVIPPFDVESSVC